MLKYVVRNPISITYMLFVAALNGALWGTMYFKVGGKPLSINPQDSLQTEQVLTNLLGLTALTVIDCFTNMGFG
jgi:hypothetical protein